MKSFKIPNTEDIDKIAVEFNGLESYEITRFQTGLCHYVFGVESVKSRFVVRVCHPDNISQLKGSIFWTKELVSKGFPVAKTLKESLDGDYCYTISEYLEGVDLGFVVNSISEKDLHGIVDNLIQFDLAANNLPLASGFGWGLNYTCSQLVSDWTLVIDNSIARAKEWNSLVGKVDLSLVERVDKKKKLFSSYLEKVQPKAYFHDLTTKNLLISPNDLSVVGFVDVDEMGFGDNLFHISLMKMALIANNHSEDIVKMWLSKIGADTEQRAIVDFYALIHCVTFMGENGQTFNKEVSSFSESYHQKLKGIYDNLYSRL